MNLPSPHTASRAPLPGCALPTAVLLAALAGCAHEPSPLERALGDTVRQAQAQQAIPAAADVLSKRAPIVTDGVIAVHGVDRYHQSWIRPPAPTTVLNIQAGGVQQAGQPNMPR